MAQKIDIWMPLYVADYLSATSRLTTEQHGAYLLLLMDYWKNGPPPDNDSVLAQITKLSPDAWANARTMLQPFFQVIDGAWVQARVEHEMNRAAQNKKANKERGLKGAQARWSRKDASSNAPSIVGASVEQCLADGTSPSPSQDTSVPKGTGCAPEDMTKRELWDAGKSLLMAAGMPPKQCGSAIGKLVKDHGNDAVIDAVRAAVVEQPADPMSYLKAACMKRGKQSSHAGFQSKNYTQGFGDASIA